jgi:hypothetical protein
LLPVRARDWSSRRAEGRAARERAPRRDLGRWDTVNRGHDAVAILRAQNTIRAEELLPVRNGRMAATPWTYYRGAAAVMAADLGPRPHSGLTVQLCGDAHLLNFGLWATPERNLSLGEAVRPRTMGRDLDHLDTRIGQHRAERDRELAGAIANEEPEPPRVLAEVHHEVAGLLRPRVELDLQPGPISGEA